MVALALVAGAIGSVRERNRDALAEYSSVREAAGIMEEAAAGRPCLVVTSRVPQVMWYSGCEATTFNLKRVRLPTRPDHVVFVLHVGGFRRQPEGVLLEAYRDAAGEPLAVVEGPRAAAVYLVSEPAGGG